MLNSAGSFRLKCMADFQRRVGTCVARWMLPAAFTLTLSGGALLSQTPTPVADPDSKIVEPAPVVAQTPAALQQQAWTMLSTSVAEDMHADLRIQTLAALGMMGSNPRSLAMIESAMKAKDIDIRIACVLAAGQTKSPALTTALRRLLDDKEPAVAFAAAITLWKMHDKSGEDILMAVADGDRATTSGFIDGAAHKLNKQLHHPGGIARFGAMQGVYMLLGPFGMGLTAYEYLHKNGGDEARVSAIEAIAEDHTAPIRAELIAALMDKDLGVRAAAARALSHYREPAVAAKIANCFLDSKPPVRLTAAAAYLISTGAVAGSPVDGAIRTRTKK